MGFAFVTFVSEAAAREAEAIVDSPGVILDGRRITLKEAQAKPEGREPSKRRRPGRPGAVEVFENQVLKEAIQELQDGAWVEKR